VWLLRESFCYSGVLRIETESTIDSATAKQFGSLALQSEQKYYRGLKQRGRYMRRVVVHGRNGEMLSRKPFRRESFKERVKRYRRRIGLGESRQDLPEIVFVERLPG
jgi:hypothetical protein